MEYWEGRMDWELDRGWTCETCGQNAGLEWGMVHAQCRCNICHTPYYMRANDEKRTVLTIPQSQLKEEYKEPVRLAFAKYRVFVENMDDEMLGAFRKVA